MKAISLFSGGLDSILATKVMKDQGIEVIALHLTLPFSQRDRQTSRCRDVEEAARQLGVRLLVVDVKKDFLEMFQKPRHGYGKNVNPCIDCRILMLKKAKEVMDAQGASFLVTGEVVGQRPMSQRREAMSMIEKEAGVKGLVLRPLCAKLLDPTIPEEKGWVDRQKLLDISGRSRKPQMQMAESCSIKDYPGPAGGCLLTDPGFTRKAKDLIANHGVTMANFELLKHGRHFRLSPEAKLVVGKDEKDNKILEEAATKEDVVWMAEESTPGPTSLGQGSFLDPQVFELAARITARYFDSAKTSSLVRLVVRRDGQTSMMDVAPMTDEETRKYLI